MEDLSAVVSELVAWKESVAPMLHQLAEDQAYRARWREERAKKWTRVQRRAAAAFAAAGAVAVVAASVVQLTHLF